ncbi:MAG TPA: hypothetical protein ENG83_10390 [Nitrospirae bacterium]|nr:hypothetical protein [Nitrospirota bacterium]HDL20067.1 hypothetical protein [Nitrospirota bacterium]HDZ00292.1 hypothetical protein [Nitrospirota bacterium]
MHKKTLVNVLGVVYAHMKTADGGDIYLTRFAEKYQEHFEIGNWYEADWFHKHKTRLKGTGSVYRIPTKEVAGKILDLVVKNCRVGEDVPLDTHTLQEFCDAEFNSPWEEFSLVEEMRESRYGPKDLQIKTQLPMAIYVPPEKMQIWQSGRSRSKINRIRAKHPGIDLDILKQYKLIYGWIEGHNLPEVFEYINIENSELLHHLKTIDGVVMSDLDKKGYLVADMKPEHIIISEEQTERIKEIGSAKTNDSVKDQIYYLYNLISIGSYSVVDYELLLRTPEHEDEVKDTRRHSYLDDQRDRFIPTPLPDHLWKMEIFGVPYIYGHAESTGGHLWVVGNNARLFDYFLPERWRKTPSISLSGTREVFYTLTKDNIHLVWETSRVGEMPNEDEEEYHPGIRESGINSPFEEFAIAHTLTRLGIPCVYVRAVYMTGSTKIEASADTRKYESHKDISDPEGNPILQENHNYITIRGYYNGPDHWVAEQTGPLYVPLNLIRAVDKGLIDESQCRMLLEQVKENLRNVDYDGSLLKPNDLLLAVNSKGGIVKNISGGPLVVICNFEHIWKHPGSVR